MPYYLSLKECEQKGIPIGRDFFVEDSIDCIELEDCTYTTTRDAIFEYISNEIFLGYFDLVPSRNKAVGINFRQEDLEEVRSVIVPLIPKGSINVYGFDDNQAIEEDWDDEKILANQYSLVASYSISNLYIDYIDLYITGESGDIEICSLWSKQLSNFICKASWHVALIANKNEILSEIKDWPIPCLIDEWYHWFRNGKEYHPTMWFGIDKDPLIKEWTINNNGIDAIVPRCKGLGDYGGQMRIEGYELNYNQLFKGLGSWYFGACGNQGADFHKIIETCPIDLLSIYEAKNGIEKVRSYCLKLQLLWSL